MKNLFNKIMAAVAIAFSQPPTITMANEGAGTGGGGGTGGAASFDFKKMVYELLGCKDDATPDMVNERYKKAMEAQPDEDEVKSANEITRLTTEQTKAQTKITELQGQVTTAANEKATINGQLTAANERATKAETDLTVANGKVTTLQQAFANERKARTKELLDTGITVGRITLAERPTFETDMANEGTFEAALARFTAKPPTLKVTSAINVKERQQGVSVEQSQRRDQVITAVNEEMGKKKCSYDIAFANVRKDKPELFKDMVEPEQTEHKPKAK